MANQHKTTPEFIAQRIRELRSLARWGQLELAIESGLNQSRISRLERNEGSPLLYHEAEALAEAFGLDLPTMLAKELKVSPKLSFEKTK